MQARWTGNVRELRNVIERAAVMVDGLIKAADLALAPSTNEKVVLTLGESFAESKKPRIESFDREYLLAALCTHQGNVSKAAEAMKLVRQTLQQRIR